MSGVTKKTASFSGSGTNKSKHRLKLGIYKTKSSIILIKYLYFRDKVKALAIYDYARIRFTY